MQIYNETKERRYAQMNKIKYFSHNNRGNGRPQVVLVGNGLERDSGQPSWNALVDMMTVPDSVKLNDNERNAIPFPLLYELLSSHESAPSQLTHEDLREEEQRLACAMNELTHTSNSLLAILPTLGADHIFTTNYSYCIEKAFYLGINFLLPRVRTKIRFNLNPKRRNARPIREINYRMHTGYLAQNSNESYVGIWHIHGECTVPRGIVIGHDRYGRLLSRMETICDSQIYGKQSELPICKQFTSWPELFLYGDIYIIGFGFNLCEYDLWWLLRRKQRECYADGKVYFYDNDIHDKNTTRDRLIQAHGGIINPGITKEADYNIFYRKALSDIAKKISKNRK